MSNFIYKLTIIIPTYNTGIYLNNALNSISNQQLNKNLIQVLVVDDGSIDNTRAIVQTHQDKNYLNIQYIYKENKNWGSVINYVKKNRLAKGEYVTILDADDWYLPKAFNFFNKLNTSYDLIISDFKKKTSLRTIRIFTYSYFLKAPKNLRQAQTPFCIPLGKFVSNDLFYKLPDLKENTFYQDALFTAHVINNAKKIFHINKALGVYNYRRIGNSMSLPWSDKRYWSEIDICLELLKIDAQEIVAIHIMRNKFRKLLKENFYTFIVSRKFNFKFFPWYTRWIVYIIYLTTLKKYFIFQN